MKIAIWHNLPSGGGKRALYYHVKGLLEKGHHIEAWCPDSADTSYLPLKSMIKEHILPLSKEVMRPWYSNHWRFRTYFSVKEKIERMRLHALDCANQIKQGDFDLLFANSCPLFATNPVGRLINLPSLLYLQEPYRPLYEAQPTHPWLQDEAEDIRKIDKEIISLCRLSGLRSQAKEERMNADAFDKILVNSFFSRESVLRAYGLESEVCYLGIDTDLFKPQSKVRQRKVIGLGGIHHPKGIDRAIRALATIPAIKRPELEWVGNMTDDGYKRKMEDVAKSLGVNVTFKERVSDMELVDRLCEAQVMIYTSRLEPFGFAPLEACACETPVVAVAEGGVRETIKDGENGILVPTSEPSRVGEALLTLLDNPILRETLGRKARQHVIEQWTWARAVERIENYCFSVAGKVRKRTAA